MDWNAGMESGMDYGLSLIPGFYYFLGRLFMCALPEDKSIISWSQRPVALLNDQGRDREEAMTIKVIIDHTAWTTDPGKQLRRLQLGELRSHDNR